MQNSRGIILAFALLSGFSAVEQAGAGVLTANNIIANPTGVDQFSRNIVAAEAAGQTFTPTVTGKIDILTVNITTFDNNRANPITASIYTASAGLPATLLGSKTLPGVINHTPSVTTSFDLQSTGIILTSGTQYAYVLSTVADSSFENYNVYGSTPSSPTYAGGEMIHTFNGTSFFTNDGYDTSFSVTIVPEPSTLLLAAFGLVGLAAWGWRRRRAIA